MLILKDIPFSIDLGDVFRRSEAFWLPMIFLKRMQRFLESNWS